VSLLFRSCDVCIEFFRFKTYPSLNEIIFLLEISSRFEGSQVSNSNTLKNITIIDTPGILSGEKQKSGRNYNYAEVLDWFAERSDLIILVFDVQKLDLSDEMGDAIKSLQKHYDKIRVVLNKADSISHQNLLKVYGALLWSLGRVITTPEVTKIHIGSFWNEPLAVSLFF